MIFSFHKDFIKYVDFKDSVEIDKPSVMLAIEELLLEYPRLYVFLAENNWEESYKTSFKLNDKYVVDINELYVPASAEDVLYIGRDIPYGESAAFRIAAAAIIAIANYAVGGNNPYVYAFAASLALGGISELVMGQPQLPTFDSGSNTSATYTFSGIKNTTVIGTPVGIVYGTHRVGGHIINAYNDVIGSNSIGNSSWLRMQIGLCEGEISQVEPSSIEINNRRASAYPKSDIEVILRYGDAQQTPPDGPVIVAEDATSTVVPNVRNFPVPNDLFGRPAYQKDWYLEYTLETPATSIDLYMSAYWGRAIWAGRYSVYWKLASDPGDYTNIAGPFYTPKDMTTESAPPIPGVLSTVVFPSVGMYKIKIVPFVGVEPYGSIGVCLPFMKQGVPTLPEGVTAALDIYLEKYVLHNSGVKNTDTVSAMEHFNKIENSVAYNLLITNDPSGTVTVDSPGVVVSTSGDVDSLKVNIASPVLYASANGALNETSVVVKVYWKLQGTGSYSENDSTTATIKGKTKSEVEYSFYVPITQAGMYDIKLVRVTKSNEDNLLISDRVYLKDVVEIVQDKLIYPHTALLGISVKATENISGGIPTVTSIVKGTKVSVPVGYNGARRIMQGSYTGQLKSTKEWTDNPVWCLYDLITNRRYGLGNYFKISEEKLGIMLANFYLMAQYCDERLDLNGNVVSPSSTAFEYARPRFSLNIVIDQSKSAIEWLTSICATMRGTLYYTEGCMFLDIDRPNKPMSQIFNMSNITEFTESGTSIKQLPNSYEVQFTNAALDYDQDTILVEDTEYRLDQSKEEYKNTLQLAGVTDEEQAKALAKYTLNVARLLTKTVTFKTSAYGLNSTVGSVVGVQHDVPQWGYGGKVKAYNTSTRQIDLYEDIPVESGKQYAIQVVTSLGEVSSELILSSVAAGTYNSFILSTPPPCTIEAGSTYVIGEYTKTVKPFKVVSVARDKDEVIQLTCVEYSDLVYSEDTSDLPATSAVPNYSQLNLSSDRSVKNVKAETSIYVDSSGAIKTGIRVYYTKSVSTLSWVGVVVFYGKNGVYSQMPLDNTGVVTISDVSEEGDYQVICVSKFTDGTIQTIDEALADSVNMPYVTIHVTPFIENTEFMKGVTGLQLVGQANDTNFVGKDIKVTWRRPAASDFTLHNYASADPFGLVNSDSWLKEYRVEIKDSNNKVLRTAVCYDETYTYSYEQNYSDSGSLPNRTVSIAVYAIDRLGRVSVPASITVSNPAPAALI